MGPKSVSEEIGRLRVLDPDGIPHELRQLWLGRTAVLVFVRHFG
ncbi:MAG TPA: hypothetical protein VN083_00465 [Vicinamibacteria bacterium]|nr:hypothetical protein [Vicinamibacteria bacterium]